MSEFMPEFIMFSIMYALSIIVTQHTAYCAYKGNFSTPDMNKFVLLVALFAVVIFFLIYVATVAVIFFA